MNLDPWKRLLGTIGSDTVINRMLVAGMVGVVGLGGALLLGKELKDMIHPHPRPFVLLIPRQ